MSIVFAAPPIPHRLGVDTWRSKWPADELKRRGHDAYYLGHGGEAETLGWAYKDTIILHATNQDVGLSGTIAYLKRLARAVYVNIDDDYTRLGDVQPVADGGGRDFAWYRALIRDIRLGCAHADGVIVATEELADVYTGWTTGKVHVLHNWVPAWVTERPVRRLKSPTVGWFGDLHAHRRDIEWLGHHARDLTRFGVVGDPDGVEEITGRRLDHRMGMQPWHALYRGIGRYAVGIVPVVDDPFNRGKSWIKALEFAAVGAFPITSRLPAYERARDAGLPMVIVDTPEDMVEWANTMTGGRQWDISPEAIRATVRRWFTLETVGGDEWEKWAAEVGAS